MATIGRLIMAQGAGEAAWGAALIGDGLAPLRVVLVTGVIVAGLIALGSLVIQGRARTVAIATEIVTVFGGVRVLHGPGALATFATSALGAVALAGLLLATRRPTLRHTDE